MFFSKNQKKTITNVAKTATLFLKMLKIYGKDVPVLLLGREILKKAPNRPLRIEIRKKNTEKTEEMPEMGRLQQKAIEKAVQESEFGRISVWVERHDAKTLDFWVKKDEKALQELYETENKPKKRARKAKNTQMDLQREEIWLLSDFIREGKEKTVEFRRLSRTFLRKSRRKNADTILILSPELASEAALACFRSLLRKKITFLTLFDVLEDVFPQKDLQTPEKELFLTLFSDYEAKWVQKRAESVLKRKISEKSLLFSPKSAD